MSRRGYHGPGVLHEPAFRHEDDLVAVTYERLPDHLLGMAESIPGGGIHAVDTSFKGAVDGADGLSVFNSPIAILSAHGPTPESKHRDRKSRPSEGPTFHRNLLFLPSAIPLRE